MSPDGKSVHRHQGGALMLGFCAQGLGLVGFLGFIGFIRSIGFKGFMGLILLI